MPSSGSRDAIIISSNRHGPAIAGLDSCPHGLFGRRQAGVDFAVAGRVEGRGEVGDVQLDHPVDRAAQQGRPCLVIEGRRSVRETRPPVDTEMRHAAGPFFGQQLDRGVAEITSSLLDVALTHDNAAISSKAAIVGNSFVGSCGSGQLDSFAATMFAARLM